MPRRRRTANLSGVARKNVDEVAVHQAEAHRSCDGPGRGRVSGSCDASGVSQEQEVRSWQPT